MHICTHMSTCPEPDKQTIHYIPNQTRNEIHFNKLKTKINSQFPNALATKIQHTDDTTSVQKETASITKPNKLPGHNKLRTVSPRKYKQEKYVRPARDGHIFWRF